MNLPLLKYSIVVLSFALGTFCIQGLAEEEDYRGIQDPFADPFTDNQVILEQPNSETADPASPSGTDRQFLLGLDIGAGIFTGGLQVSTAPSVMFGARLTYFFTPQVAIELSAGTGSFLDQILTTNEVIDVDTKIIPITLGLRYYIGNPSDKTIQAVNPYIGIGGGNYIRQQRVLTSTTIQGGDNSQTGAWGSLGLELPISKRKIFLGLDLRYHLIFFIDEDDDLNGLVAVGDRAGDLFVPSVTFSYNF